MKYDGAGEIQLLDLSNLSQKKMGKNSGMLFYQLGKNKSKLTTEGRILRAASEHTMRDIDGGVI